MLSYNIRPAMQDEWEDAMSLAWLVFSKFEAKEYDEEGTKSFLEFISDNVLFKMFKKGIYKLFVAVEGNKIIGLISLRDKNHISLLFVDEHYHKMGIGRDLIQYVQMFLFEEQGIRCCTVNAAPYAIGFYHKLGFCDMGDRCISDGIIYTPMKKEW